MVKKKAPAKTTAPARRDRNAQSPEVKKVGGEAPDWLMQHTQDDKSTGDLAEHRVLPRLKVIQAMTDRDMKKEHGEGSVILSPGGVRIIDFEAEEEIDIVPVLFFVEFCKWSDLNDTQANTILERSFDPSSDLAKRARDPKRREEVYGENNQYKYKFVEHLNFACVIYSASHPMYGIPFVASFSRGEFGQGKRFINAILLRRIGQNTAPLWSQVWRISSSFRKSGENEWFGIDFTNPEEPFIKQEEVELFKTTHEGLLEEFTAKRLFVDHSEGGDTDGDVPPSDEM